MGFSMWVILLYKLVTGIDLDLYIVLTVSVLLSLEVSTVSLDVCYFSVLSNVLIFFFSDIGNVLASLTTFSLYFSSLSTVSMFVLVGLIDAPSLSFLCLFEGTDA